MESSFAVELGVISLLYGGLGHSVLTNLLETNCLE